MTMSQKMLGNPVLATEFLDLDSDRSDSVPILGMFARKWRP